MGGWLSGSKLLAPVAILLWGVGAYWCLSPALRASWGLAQLPSLSLEKTDWTDPSKAHGARRRVQRHFLEQGVYIPMDDIISAEDLEQRRGPQQFLVKNGCSKGNLYVFVPMKIYLPFVGSRIIEWCSSV